MRRLLAALLLLALLPASAIAQPAPLPVRAELQAGALVVTWQAPAGQAFGCVFARSPDRLLGCALGTAGRWARGPARWLPMVLHGRLRAPPK